MTEKTHISHSSPGAIFSRIFNFTLRHQALVLLLLFLVTVISLSGLQRLEIDTGFQSLIPEYDKGKQADRKSVV